MEKSEGWGWVTHSRVQFPVLTLTYCMLLTVRQKVWARAFHYLKNKLRSMSPLPDYQLWDSSVIISFVRTPDKQGMLNKCFVKHSIARPSFFFSLYLSFQQNVWHTVGAQCLTLKLLSKKEAMGHCLWTSTSAPHPFWTRELEQFDSLSTAFLFKSEEKYHFTISVKRSYKKFSGIF